MDEDSMTALRYITCNSRAFGEQKIRRREFIEEIIKSESSESKMQKIGKREFIEEIIISKSDQQGLRDVISAAIEQLIDSGTVFTIIYYSFTHILLLFGRQHFCKNWMQAIV